MFWVPFKFDHPTEGFKICFISVKISYCQKSLCFIRWKLILKVSNSSFLKLILKPSFFCQDFQKTVKSNRRQRGRPLMVARKGDIGSPSGQSPIGLHCFLEIQTEKITHGRCLIQEFWIKKIAASLYNYYSQANN